MARASAEPASALATWTEAVGLDPACATGWYGLGEAKAAAGDHAGAWAAFDKAAWLDHGTFRLLPQVAADARAVCDDGSCVAVDLDAFLERVAGPDEYGRGFFASPSHFSLEGDERIGTAVARAIADHFAAEERRTLPR